MRKKNIFRVVGEGGDLKKTILKTRLRRENKTKKKFNELFGMTLTVLTWLRVTVKKTGGIFRKFQKTQEIY
jgi:hypothetical protein